LPNLQTGKVLVGGVVKRVKACASCLAKFKVSSYKKTAPATT